MLRLDEIRLCDLAPVEFGFKLVPDINFGGTLFDPRDTDGEDGVFRDRGLGVSVCRHDFFFCFFVFCFTTLRKKS